MQLYTKDNLLIVTQVLDKFIKPTTFFRTCSFHKLFLKI